MKKEIIQQWQFLGKVHPKLLEDKIFEDCKKIGITSLQSYVLWSEIEKEKGKIDFSTYDVLVEKIKKHNLKWIPFLILGPNYATPEWFKSSKESVFAKCLEHQKESKIQSIWNPNLPKYVERFLRVVSEHYKDKEILESIGLGISGNWGEAIYPGTGGFYGGFHTHWGRWCADSYARKNFQEKTLQSDFPPLKRERQREIIYWLIEKISKSPSFIKIWPRLLRKLILSFNKKSFFLNPEETSHPLKKEEKEDWLNFVKWYLDSMTDFAEFWIKTARKYFPETKIYLMTGGTGNPILGADFSAQVKVAAKYGVGIRITNQTNNYPQSFILTRLVSSACRFYGAYFVTEEAAVLQTPEGVIMRIFDAVSSGAQGIYCKNFVSTGNDDPCLKKNLSVGKVTQGGVKLSENLQYLINASEPIIKVAIFFPSSSIAFDSAVLTSLYNQSARIRDVLDFDLVDERMIKDGALKGYQFLLILKGEMPEEISEEVKNWIEGGGRLISHPREEDLEFIKEIIGDIDNEYDGVYATRFSDKIIYYNSTNKKIKKRVLILKKMIEVESHSIVSINL
jgi:hypothetical protein